jgi:hypothetical protein
VGIAGLKSERLQTEGCTDRDCGLYSTDHLRLSWIAIIIRGLLWLLLGCALWLRSGSSNAFTEFGSALWYNIWVGDRL